MKYGTLASSFLTFTLVILLFGTGKSAASLLPNNGINVSSRSSSAQSAEAAIFYKHCNYAASGYAINLEVGSYTLPQLLIRGIQNDDISSLKVASGYEVVLYADDNFQGTSWTYRADQPCLGSTGNNDQVSSLKIQPIAQPAPQAATVYKHCNYDTSGYAVNLGVGTYTAEQLAARGISDNDISSLKINSGYEIVLYENDNFAGTSWTYQSDQSCLALTGNNDVISSLKIQVVSSTPPSNPIATPAYYVSPFGNDSGTGSILDPFQSLRRAQSAAQSSSQIKTIVLRAGTYSLSAPISLSAIDKNQNWIGYPGETAIINANGSDAFVINNASDIAIENLIVRNVRYGVFANDHSDNIKIRWNTFQNCALNCVNVNYYSTNILVDSNSLDGGGTGAGDPYGRSLGTYHAAIYVSFGSSYNTISRNLIQNFGSVGVAIVAGGNPTDTKEKYFGNVVDRNIIKNVNTSLYDSGAIYVIDRTHQSSGTRIVNNYVDGNGTVTQSTKAFYIDDQASNVIVTGNICRNCGQYAVQYHGGDHINVQNNIFDLSSGAKIGLYQDDVDPGLGLPNYGMANNTFKNNIIYFSNAAPNRLWDFDNAFSGSPVEIALPSVANNLYWSQSGAPIPNSGVILDVAPKYANPQFSNPSGGDYSMPSNSPVYTQIDFAPLVTDRGPLPLPASLPQ